MIENISRPVDRVFYYCYEQDRFRVCYKTFENIAKEDFRNLITFMSAFRRQFNDREDWGYGTTNVYMGLQSYHI